MTRARFALLMLLATGCATTSAQAPAPGAGTPDIPATPAARAAQRERAQLQLRAAFDRALAPAGDGDLAAADQELTALLTAQPTLAYGWTDLGILREREGRPADAEAAYRRALSLAPQQAAAWEDRVRLACRAQRCAQVEGELRLAIANSPGSLSLRNALVEALLQQRQWPAAEAEAKKILKADEQNAPAMARLARVYLAQGKHELARMVLENARAVDSRDPEIWTALGLAQVALGDRPGARSSFQKAAALQPDCVEAANDAGALLNEAEDYADAIPLLEQAARAAPQLAAVHLNLGNAYRGAQRPQQALAEYQRVLALAPDDVNALYDLAIFHLDSPVPPLEDLERFGQAIAYFRRYEQLAGADPTVDQYLKDAARAQEREQRRREREAQEQLRPRPKPPALHPAPPPSNPAPASDKLGEDDK